MSDPAPHWDDVYRTKPAGQVSWFRPHLDVSLQLLTSAGLSQRSRVMDIGAGASTLVDDLLERGVEAITALDISPAALQVSRDRLGERAARVRWMAADITRVELARDSVDLWHDRATLHFLTNPADAAAYVRAARCAIASGGYAVIGGFASDGPPRCSQLDVVRRDPEQIAALFGDGFSLVERRREEHMTPWGAAQAFAYALLQKRPGCS